MSETENPELEDEDESADVEEEEACDPVMVDPFDPTKINIVPKQDTLRNLIDRLRNDEIDMNTYFQRHPDLWSSPQMSRLIESILIRFPLPAFYFDASDDNKWLVVDGLQRLSSIRKFVVKDQDESAKPLRLCGLEYLKDLNTLAYEKLPRQYQRRIDECPITLFLIQPGTPDNVKYSVFRRINTGGLVLNNQEIRNALARPKERKFLEDLAKDENLVRTMGNQSKRMIDQELVLRFISFYTQDYLKSRKNIAVFMDEAMEALKSYLETELHRIAKAFRQATRLSYQIFGEGAFEKRVATDSDRRKRKNTTLFEVWTVCLAELVDKDPAKVQRLLEDKEQVVEKLQILFESDGDFFRSITFATQKRDHVRIRYDRVRKIIQEVAGA